MAMHKIQKFILAQLSEHDSRRYSEMRPSSMEASQFMYHLKKLIQQGLVAKLAVGSYALSAQGWLYVDRADSNNLDIRAQPRLGAMIICRHPDKGLLYMRRGVQPARGYIGFPIIDIPLGFELPLPGFVNQSFQSMTGLKVEIEHCADGYINLLEGTELAGSLFAHVFVGSFVSGELRAHELFDFCWEADLPRADRKKLLRSNDYILKQMNKHPDFFFFEYSFTL